MREYLRKNGIRMAIIVLSVALLIALNTAARNGRTGFLQNMTGVLESPVKRVLSSTVHWFNTLYGQIFEYDSLLAENESLRSQLADAQASARDVFPHPPCPSSTTLRILSVVYTFMCFSSVVFV